MRGEDRGGDGDRGKERRDGREGRVRKEGGKGKEKGKGGISLPRSLLKVGACAAGNRQKAGKVFVQF